MKKQQTRQGSFTTPSIAEYKPNEAISGEDQAIMMQWQKEMIAMQNNRRKHERQWLRYEKSMYTEISELEGQNIKNDIKMDMMANSTIADVKIQIDRNILEQNIGEDGFKLPYKVVPVGKNADSNALQLGQYTLDYFIKKEDVISEIVDFRWDRGLYGTGFLDSNIWVTRVVNNRPKEGDFQATEFEEEITLLYHIGVRNCNIWDLWIDERAQKWTDVKRVIRREKLDIEEFRATYSGKPGFKYVDSVIPVHRDYIDQNERNKDNYTLAGDPRNVFLFHTYNETTGEYKIIANRQWPIYVGKNIYKDSKIPLDACQMYYNSKSIYGMAIGGKTESFLTYMNNLFSVTLDKVYNASNPPLVLGNNGTIDGEIYTGGGELPILNFNGDASQIKQLQFDSRIESHQSAIDMSRNEIIQNTGINPLDYNKPLSGINPFVAGIQEQSKRAKLALSNALFDMCVGSALSKMMDNIIRFGPALYGKVINKIVDGEALEEVEYLEIEVPNKIVKARGKTLQFDDAPNEYGYFQLTKDLFKGKNGKHLEMSVQVVTPTTETLLDSLKKDEFNTFIQNLTLFTQLYPGQPLPIEAQELYEMMGEVYGFDVDNIQGSSETKKRRQKVNEMISTLQQMNPANILGKNQTQPTAPQLPPELAQAQPQQQTQANNPNPFA